MATRKNFVPSYRLHKPSGQGIVEFKGKRIYLGLYESPETREKYHRLIAEWLANERTLPPEPSEMTIVELCAAYWKWCTRTYPGENGKLSSTSCRRKSVIRELRALYGTTLADEFNPKCLQVLQAVWVRQGFVRKTVNEYTAIARRIFRWGTTEGLVANHDSLVLYW